MAETIYQDATWPGVLGVESCSGTVSHGITPATFVMTTFPQIALPATEGNLSIGDGRRRVVFRGCKLDSVTGRASASGQEFTLTILDRRWKWRFGAISGRYNQTDNRGKLVPWTIRSPRELAELCLKAMGERNYRIHLPEGLPAAAGANIERFLKLGEDFPQSFTNPPIVWDMTPPAEALARLCDLYGCHVIYQPVEDRVLIAPLGVGRPLPNGPCEMIAPNIDSPEKPIAVAVAGAPVRIQMRLLLEPVGREWDGSWRPADELSYAPQGGGKVQISTVTWAGVTAAPSVKVYIRFNTDWKLPVPPPDKNVRLAFEYGGAGAGSDKLLLVQNAIGNHAEANRFLIANAAGDVLTIQGREKGFSFSLTVETSTPLPDTLTAALTQAPEKDGGDWRACPPPEFQSVRATDRLSHDQAVLLAQQSVYKCFRVLNADPGTGRAPIQVPWYGPIKRRHQLVLQNSKVDQVVPEGREKGVQRPVPNVAVAIRAAAGGGVPEFYDGYSRDQGADVYGSVSKQIGNIIWDGVSLNTNDDDKVKVGFSIDPVSQVVTFSDYVFVSWPIAGTNFQMKFPELTLETAVLVQDATTGEVARWKEIMALGGTAPIEWQIREDVQACIAGNYGAKNQPLGFDFIDTPEAIARARYYLNGAAARFQITGGETRQYIGIYPIDPDGAIQQVSLSVGPGGASTVASTNTEHSSVIPAYPARRRVENLPPNKAAAAANFFEAHWLAPKMPKKP